MTRLLTVAVGLLAAIAVIGILLIASIYIHGDVVSDALEGNQAAVAEPPTLGNPSFLAGGDPSRIGVSATEIQVPVSERSQIAVKEWHNIIGLLRAHPDRDYWGAEQRQELSHEMLQAIDGVPEGQTLDVETTCWVGLATDLSHQEASISPQQWAAEMGRCFPLS